MVIRYRLDKIRQILTRIIFIITIIFGSLKQTQE